MTRNQLENRRQGRRNRIVETMPQEEFGEVCRKLGVVASGISAGRVSGGNSVRDELGRIVGIADFGNSGICARGKSGSRDVGMEGRGVVGKGRWGLAFECDGIRNGFGVGLGKSKAVENSGLGRWRR